MRVLQINSVCGVGSTGKIAVGIHDLLTKKGYESCIAYGRGTPQNCDSTIKIGNQIDNYLHVAYTRMFDRHGFGSKRATRKFINKIEQYKPDVIHLHNIHGYYLNIRVLFNYLKANNFPTIWTLHDCWAYTGHCAYYSYVDCSKWKDLCCQCPAKKNYPKSILVDMSRRNYSDKKEVFSGHNNLVLVTPSNWLRKELSESFMCNYPVRTINNGIDVDAFRFRDSSIRKKYQLENKRIILGVANVWESRKGLSRFFDVADYISNEEVVVIVGKIPDINEQSKVNSLSSKIIHIERTDNPEQLSEIYSAADVYFNPTHEDNYPTTNLEALACGCPVVTFDVGGSPESIGQKDGLVLSRATDTSKLIEKIRSTYSSENDFIRLDIEMRAKGCYDKNNKFLEYISLYQKLTEDTCLIKK